MLFLFQYHCFDLECVYEQYFPCRCTGMATLITVTILRIPDLNLKDIADILDWLFMVFPPYSLAASITDLYTNFRFTKICDNEGIRLACDLNVFTNPCCRGASFDTSMSRDYRL